MGAGLYLDDIEQTLREVDWRAQANIDQILAWAAGTTATSILLAAGSGLALNVSDHHQADVKLRQLTQQVVRSQEDERARVSRELYDGTGQAPVSTKLLLEIVYDCLEAPAASPTSIEWADSMLRRALDRLNGVLGEVWRVSHNLRPVLLDDLGLAAALELLVREMREAHEDSQPGSAIALELVGPSVQLSDACNAALFHTAQEAVPNTERHATQATRIGVLLENDTDAACLPVRDNGPSFDVELVQVDPQHGIDLRSMRERMIALSGTCVITSGPHGTEMCVVLPYVVIAQLASAPFSPLVRMCDHPRPSNCSSSMIIRSCTMARAYGRKPCRISKWWVKPVTRMSPCRPRAHCHPIWR